MRLYTKTGATQVDDPEYGTFTPDKSGAFEFPDAMAVKLHGRPGWETEEVRTARIASEELDRLRDPATLLAELRKMGDGQGALTQLMAHALGMAPAAAADGSSSPTPPESPAETSDETPVEKSPAETPKTTSTRGRGGKAAKTAASDAS